MNVNLILVFMELVPIKSTDTFALVMLDTSEKPVPQVNQKFI